MSKMYYVGGAVRDYFIRYCHPEDSRRASKDIDFAVEVDSYYKMLEYLKNSFEVEVVQEDADFGRIIGKIAKTALNNHPILEQVQGKYLFADFVLCRKDGCYSDHRRPDKIEYASIEEDLARRDFTINSLAIPVDGSHDEVLDPFNGISDIRRKQLRFNGSIYDRVTEDYLRVLRLYRFLVTLHTPVANFQDTEIEWTIPKRTTTAIQHYSSVFAKGIKTYVSEDRIREELLKMFKYNTLHALYVLSQKVPHELRKAMLGGTIWLEPTSRKK